jgi:hypothetical protein
MTDTTKTEVTALHHVKENFLSQLEYLIGKENQMKNVKRFYSDFKFKTPNTNDVKRTAEEFLVHC